MPRLPLSGSTPAGPRLQALNYHAQASSCFLQWGHSSSSPIALQPVLATFILRYAADSLVTTNIRTNIGLAGHFGPRIPADFLAPPEGA